LISFLLEIKDRISKDETRDQKKVAMEIEIYLTNQLKLDVVHIPRTCYLGGPQSQPYSYFLEKERNVMRLNNQTSPLIFKTTVQSAPQLQPSPQPLVPSTMSPATPNQFIPNFLIGPPNTQPTPPHFQQMPGFQPDRTVSP
jgi:hypothetical protein